ncbi:MAG: iron-sulfur cluster assembly accessory protein [Gammaproteobacteria bacterium]
MITITPAAADMIHRSASEGNINGLPMRIAAKRNPDGSIHYGMGFDDNELEGDIHVKAGDIDVVIADTSQPLLEGTTLDYVELEPDTWQFIFMNPNDTNFSPPA